MTTTPEPAREAGFFTAIRGWGIVRPEGGVLGGVIKGLGERIGMAPVPARIIFVVLTLLTSGLGFLVYAAGWALLPDQQGRIIIQDFGRGVPNVGALIGIGIMTLLGLGGFDDGPFFRFDTSGFDMGNGHPARIVFAVIGIALTLLFVAGVVALIVWAVKRSNAQGPPPPPSAFAVPPVGTSASGTDAGATSGAQATAGVETTPGAAPGPVYAALPVPKASASRGAGPAYPPAPPRGPAAPPRPYVPPRPRVPGAGRGFWLLTLSWFVLSIAGVAWAERLDRLVVHAFPAWVALFLTGLGVIMVLVSLAGRKTGGLTVLAVPFLIAALIIGTQPDELRDAYWEFRNAIDDGIAVDADVQYDPEPRPVVFAADTFSRDYQQIELTGECTDVNVFDLIPTGNLTQLSFTEISGDQTVSANTEYVALTIPEGTSLLLEKEGGYPITVVWTDREIQCQSAGIDTFRVALSNPDAPVLTLDVGDDYATTIIIEEN